MVALGNCYPSIFLLQNYHIFIVLYRFIVHDSHSVTYFKVVTYNQHKLIIQYKSKFYQYAFALWVLALCIAPTVFRGSLIADIFLLLEGTMLRRDSLWFMKVVLRVDLQLNNLELLLFLKLSSLLNIFLRLLHFKSLSYLLVASEEYFVRFLLKKSPLEVQRVENSLSFVVLSVLLINSV